MGQQFNIIFMILKKLLSITSKYDIIVNKKRQYFTEDLTMKVKSISLLLAALLLCSCSGDEGVNYESHVIEVITQQTAVTSAETTTFTTPPPPKDKKITITALGDNLIHSSIYNQAQKRARQSGGTGYDFNLAYEGIADMLGNADITVLNQETLICGDEYKPSTYPRFNSPEALGFKMHELGVDVYTMANNHCLDMGEQGLADCLGFYNEYGYIQTGAYLDTADRADIRTMEVNGVTVSFLSYTENLNGLSLPEGSPLEIGLYDKEIILSEIQRAKQISDICVLSLHWGLENSCETQDYQRTDAREFCAAGADVIIGTHPHVLRETELIENPDGSTSVCAYSLGNLISAQSVGRNLIGAILDIEITLPADGISRAYVSDAQLTPIVTHYDKGYSGVRVMKFSDYTPELAAAHGVRSNSRFSYEFVQEVTEEFCHIKVNDGT